MPSPGVSKDGHSGTGRGASLVAQWPVQETQVPSLIQEDPTGHGATKPVDHDY